MVRYSRSLSPEKSPSHAVDGANGSLPRLDEGTLQELGNLAPALQRAVGVGDATRSAELLEQMRGMLPREAAAEGAVPVAIPRRWIPRIVEELQAELRTGAAAPTVGRQIQLLALAFRPRTGVGPYQRLLAAVMAQTGFEPQATARALDAALIAIRHRVDRVGQVEFPELALTVAPSCPRESRPEPVSQDGATHEHDEALAAASSDGNIQGQEPDFAAFVRSIRSQGMSAAQSVGVAHAIIDGLCASVLRRQRIIIPSLGELVRTSDINTRQLRATLNTFQLWPGRSSVA